MLVFCKSSLVTRNHWNPCRSLDQRNRRFFSRSHFLSSLMTASKLLNLLYPNTNNKGKNLKLAN